MPPLHVLVIDDDLVTRRAVSCALKQTAGDAVRVLGLGAADPDYLRERLGRLSVPPDVVLVNLETEGAALERLALVASLVTQPIVVMTPRTHDGAALAMRALEQGAVEVVTTPERPTHVLFAQRHLRKRLLPALRAAAFGGMFHQERVAPPPFELGSGGAPSGVARPVPEVVVVGACTGGPHALATWLRALPEDLATPVLIVQHLPRAYTRALARWLTAQAGRDVREAPARGTLQSGTVWVAPGGRHLEFQRVGAQVEVVTHRGPREYGCRPAIDVLFRSAARTFGPNALAVVLVGAGYDGVEGARAIREAGGSVLVQEAGLGDVWELPAAVAEAGLADAALPLEALAAEVAARTQTGAPTALTDRASVQVAREATPGLPRGARADGP